jgi:hypothetical protein
MAKGKKTRDALQVSDEEIHASQLDPGDIDIAVVLAFDDDGGSYEDSSGGPCPGGGTLCQGTYCEKSYSSKAMIVR